MVAAKYFEYRLDNQSIISCTVSSKLSVRRQVKQVRDGGPTVLRTYANLNHGLIDPPQPGGMSAPLRSSPGRGG